MADELKARELAPIERQALDRVWIHTARWLDLAERDGLHVIVRGEGSTLYHAHGRAFLDGLSGLYVVNVGHGRKEIGEAMAKQAVSSPMFHRRAIRTPLRCSSARSWPS